MPSAGLPWDAPCGRCNKNHPPEAMCAPRDVPDLDYVLQDVLQEFRDKFIQWNAEYPAERPLGARAEWHHLHRKVNKLKRPMWDGADVSAWREDPRTILLEIIGHAALAIASLDRGELR